MTSLRTTFFMLGLSLLWYSIVGLWPYNMCMWYMHMERLDTFDIMYIISYDLSKFVHSCIKLSSYLSLRFTINMTRYLELGPRNTYLKLVGKCLKFISGASFAKSWNTSIFMCISFVSHICYYGHYWSTFFQVLRVVYYLYVLCSHASWSYHELRWF